jgi:hypothetical protein
MGGQVSKQLSRDELFKGRHFVADSPEETMSKTAGFTVVSCVKQDLINSALRIASANFAPAYSFSLPGAVAVGNTTVGIAGSLVMIAPQVTLQTRPDNLVSVTVGFAGQLFLAAGNQTAFTDVLLSTTVLLGLVTQVSTAGNTQQITVGLDPTVASVTAVDISVLSGAPLANTFTDALTAGPVLAALTGALRATPAKLLEISPQQLSVPLQVLQTYQPPKGSVFFPKTLFQLTFSISRIITRPLTASSGGSGVLALAVDASQPIATAGDANSLTDLSGSIPTGPSIEYTDGGGASFSPGGGSVNAPCDIAVYINSSWVAEIVNSVISPQLAGKFIPQLNDKNNVGFTTVPDCLQITFNDVSASLDNPLSPPIPTNVSMSGMRLQVKVTLWAGVNVDNQGYYTSGKDKIIDATFTAQIALMLMQNGRQNQPKPVLPILTNDYYGAFVIGHDVALPWWVEPVTIFLGPLYITGSVFFGLAGTDIWYPTIVANANNTAGQGLQSALGGLFSDQKTQLVAQLPGTTAPDWEIAIAGLGVSSDACFSCVDMNLLPPGLGSGTGSFPYLLLTDQPVNDPNTVPNVPGYPFPVRFDGSFNWPGISYNQPGYGVLGGDYTWDVHDLNPIGVVLKIPPGLFNPQDPTVFVSWTATRTDTNTQLISQTLALGQPGALTVSIAHASAALQAADGFQVNCTLFRQLAGGGVEQIFNSGNVNIQIVDHFDRHHPYASWGSHVKYVYPGQPFWNAIPAKQHVRGLRWVKTARASRIHRTDLWSGGRRCLVAETSGLMGNPPRKSRGTIYDRAQVPRGIGDFTYLDSLPISLADVQRDRNVARGILCDYCFFGGPTKTTLRTDFP